MMRILLLPTLFSCVMLILANTAHAAAPQAWRFKVFLDNKEIGQHTFKVMTEDNTRYVAIEARFDVNILFFNAYSYQHSNYEVWQGECLKTIRSQTNDDGETQFVEGESEGNIFVLNTVQGENQIAGCIKTFSYWDPTFLSSTHLLNAQTGELLSVSITDLGNSTIETHGNPLTARQYRIVTDKFTIDLWYSPQREWLALQSTTRDGAVLRYQRH